MNILHLKPNQWALSLVRIALWRPLTSLAFPEASRKKKGRYRAAIGRHIWFLAILYNFTWLVQEYQLIWDQELLEKVHEVPWNLYVD